MSEYAALHNVSLKLVGSKIQVRNSFSTSESFDHDSIFSDPIPDDELFIHYKDIRTDVTEDPQETTGIETIMQPTEERGVIILIEDVASGPEARWRTHGLDRRRTILEDDVRLGGRNFALSFECSVQRYYSIAHRALEEFHQLYERSYSIHNQHELEEIYVMGYRIVSFLTECLPKHPRLNHSPNVLEQSEAELKHLRKCIEDLALRIDGIVCNETVDDGDNYLDRIIAEQMEKADDEDDDEWHPSHSDNSKNSSWSSSDFDVMPFQLESWVKFDEFEGITSANQKKERNLTESSTSDTVETTGTASVEDDANDDIRDHYAPIWEDESFKSYSSQPLTLLRKSANLDFLKKVACEPIIYETDSDADDSWANGKDTSNDSKPSSSGAAPTSDPARLAFRNIMDKFPLKSFTKQSKSPTDSHPIPKSIKTTISSPARSAFSNIQLPLKPIFQKESQLSSKSSTHNEPLPEANEAPTHSPQRFVFPNVTHPLKCMMKENSQPLTESPIDIQPLSDSPITIPTNDLACVVFRDIMEELPHESLLKWNCQSLSESPTFTDIDDDILDQVVEDEIQAYLEETQNENIAKESQPSVQADRRITDHEQQQQRLHHQQRRQSPPRKTETEEVGTQEFRRRKLDQKLDKQQQKIERQHRPSVGTTVRSVRTFKSSDSASRGSKKKLSVSFDEASISTSSTTSFSIENSTGTPTSSYKSLGSLRGGSIGSQTSAFSAYSPRKQKQQLRYQYNAVSEEQPFDEVHEDWINFQNGSSFFSQ